MSQQPAAIRLDTQCEQENNGWSSLVDGMLKRPPTEHKAVLSSAVSDSSFVHTINRDANERYEAIFTGDATEPIEVFTNTGVKCTVRYGMLTDDFVFTEDLTTKDYLTDFGTQTPTESLRVVTSADSSLVVNNTVTCAMSGIIEGSIKKQALAYVKKGVAETTYQLLLNGVVVSTYTSGVSTSYSTYSPDVIATALVSNWAAAAGAFFYGDGVTRTFTSGGTVSIIVYKNGVLQTLGSSYTVSDNRVTFSVAPNAATPPTYATDEYGNTSIVADGVGPDIISITSNASTPYTFVRKGSTIIITRTDGNDFTLKAYDTWGEQALSAIKNSVQKFEDLPPTAFDAFTVEILGSPDSDTDNYWVKYTEMGNTGNWQECTKPGIDNAYDVATMPHRLVRTAINLGIPEFTFTPIPWDHRAVGDETTAAPCTFIGNTINDIFFYRNRLGMLSSENIILSRAGDFFNYFPSSAMVVLDDDPIDIATSTNEVSILYHAEPFNTSLLIFSEQTQFVLQSGTNPLTPKTAALDITTHFPTARFCRPASAGSNVYFVAPKQHNSTVKEYFVQANTLTNDAADVAAHVPRLLPANIRKLVSSSNLDMVLAFSSDTPDTIYVYKYYWNADQKAQSAWSTWKFDGDIINIDFLDTQLWLVVKRGSEVSLEVMTLEKEFTDALPFRVHLDRLKTLQGVYVSGTTTWTLPYSDTDTEESFNVILSSNGNRVYNIEKPTASTITALGDYSASPCYVGKTYEHRYRFSEWFMKAPNSNVGSLVGRLQMRTLTLNFTNTGYFRIEVTPKGRELFATTYNGAILGSSRLGHPSIVSETRRFPVLANAQGTLIDIVNDSYLPSEFHSATLEGYFTSRSQAV